AAPGASANPGETGGDGRGDRPAAAGVLHPSGHARGDDRPVGGPGPGPLRSIVGACEAMGSRRRPDRAGRMRLALWEWAVAAYARPGVSDVCLQLQDGDGQNVPLL